MTENEAIEELKYDCNELGKAIPCDTSCGKSFENAYAMAIKALEEVQRWHTSVINPNIKNEFANTSTQICHNCDHKDEYIEELEAEVEEYRTIGTPEECKKSVAVCKAMIARKITPENMEEYMKFEDECVECGFTLKSLLEAREKQTAKKIEIFNGQASCPNCKYLFGEMDIIKNLRTWNMPHCKDCGQKLDWSDEE